MNPESQKPSQENAIRADTGMPNPVPEGRADLEESARIPPDIKKDDASDDTEERSNNLGCGVAFILVGAGMFAQNFGWIPKGDWIWPSALIGLGVAYLYKVYRK